MEKILSKCFKVNREMGEKIPLLYEDETEEFYQIGKVVGFVLYPVDCGTGYKFGEALCTPTGIEMIGSEKYIASDRTMVVFNKSTKQALFHPEFTMPTDENEIHVFCYEQYFKNRIPPAEGLEVVEVDYLGTTVPLLCFPAGHEIEKQIQISMFKNREDKDLLRLGYFMKRERAILNEKHRYNQSESHNWNDDMIKKAFLPNYSNYTLINAKTFRAICGKSSDLNYRNFRPQIIIDFYRPFAEEFVEEIQIRTNNSVIIFDHIIPCVVEETNYSPKKCSTDDFLKVYERLKSDHTLHNKYPMFAKGKDPVLPVFGINMELKKESNESKNISYLIKQGDIVYAKYKNFDYNGASTFASTSASTSTPTKKKD